MNIIKSKLSFAVCIAALCASSVVMAGPITGSLALGGQFALTDSAGGAIDDSPLSMSFSTAFGGSDSIIVSSASSGDFAGLAGSYGSINTLEFDPTSPANACLNCLALTPFYTVGDFSFNLDSLAVNLLTDTDISLYGTGVMNSANPGLDAIIADWALTGDVFSGLTFTWSSTSTPVSEPVAVPEPGIASLLALGLLFLGYSRGIAK